MREFGRPSRGAGNHFALGGFETPQQGAGEYQRTRPRVEAIVPPACG
jgi:hypothetical protein